MEPKLVLRDPSIYFLLGGNSFNDVRAYKLTCGSNDSHAKQTSLIQGVEVLHERESERTFLSAKLQCGNTVKNISCDSPDKLNASFNELHVNNECRKPEFPLQSRHS